uniref:Uncharacterized protein n=1 Tax=Castor canadensis TaxID=51338 RepID=A0A8C0XZ22_CASCN
MLGVNVAKSSLHLHFLKTLEFRTDVSVISMAGVAEAIRLAAWPCASLDPWGSDGGAEPTCQVQCFCFVPL